ncbi:hypothetical protein M422DRAFT_270271 [Sphaerobolus stellatus SS14]|uniref:Uncharacterized protein n=1 Tax=Sphaerobolus stellatus (strain SS14) TaxID=990650 RepID=A0A0C9UHM7_SPHS4|nr:hypothetical protein M422DRAFT_270271 [Sphaerobolus stellatus SS14]
MERHEEKRPCSTTGTERAAYMQLNQRSPAPHKGSQQQLDTDLDSYHQMHELILPYEEGPPSGVPDVEMHVPAVAGTSGTLPNESTMNVDHELDDLYE